MSAETVRLPLVDQARGRALPTHLDLPASDPPWPLVVFAHGWKGHPGQFGRLFRSWAAAGYAVAAPAFPHTNRHSPTLDDDDVLRQPADMRFVVDRLLDDGRFDAARVAVGGFSLGAATALAVAFESSQRDSRVAAVVAISGRLRPTASADGEAPTEFGGRYALRGCPLLVVHGALDPVVDYGNGLDVYRHARPPKALLTILIPGHGKEVVDEPATDADAAVDEVTTAFLGVGLRGRDIPRPRVDPEVARLESEGIW